MADVFDDYTMSLIQFGYVALFSAAFPLAPLLAMINNLVQTRVDAHKICKTRSVHCRGLTRPCFPVCSAIDPSMFSPCLQ